MLISPFVMILTDRGRQPADGNRGQAKSRIRKEKKDEKIPQPQQDMHHSRSHIQKQDLQDFRTVLFYEKKARGGAASVNYGETPVNNVDAVRRPNVDVIRPDFSRMILPAKDWIKFTDAIHRHGANPCVQLAHAGLFAEPFFNGASTGKVIGPVEMDKENGTHVTAMDEEDMARIAGDFAEAALCAVQSGFNQVMVQCCHGWLLAQFLSPAWNTRTDE